MATWHALAWQETSCEHCLGLPTKVCHISDITIVGSSMPNSCWELVVFSQDRLGLLLVGGLSKALPLYKGPVGGAGLRGGVWIWAVAGKAATRASKEPPEAPGDGDGDILPCGSSLPML